MQLSSTCARVAGLALVTLLAACADNPTGLTPVGGSFNGTPLHATVTPLATHVFAGSDLRALIAVENHGDSPITGVATLCAGTMGVASCAAPSAQLVLPTLAASARLIDTATVTLAAAPSDFVDVPQLFTLRACAAPSVTGATPSCATSAVVRVLPDFERVCSTTPLAIGDSIINPAVSGDCSLSSTGTASKIYSVFARANDTLSISLDPNGFCATGLAVFDRDGEIVHATMACGAASTITIPVAVGGTYHVAVGRAPAGYVLRASYVATDFVSGDPTQP